jgi:hypothetical protein
MRRNTSPNRYATTLLLLTATLATKKIHAQWDIEDSNTTASLRGIHNAGGGVAWASGTNGTVLRTEDGGYLWQTCTIPPGAEKLDFRGIQAFDENTAIVMSSGKGDLSRLYKTTDGCQTWKLLFTNPDKEGFWDAIVGVPDPKHGSPGGYSGMILGDPVNSSFTLLHAFVMHMRDQEMSSLKQLLLMEQDRYPKKRPEPQPLPGESSFAASNSSLIKLWAGGFAFATGGASEQPRVIGSYCYWMGDYMPCHTKVSSVPMTSSPSGGIFSIAAREFSDHCQSDEDWKKTMDRAEQNMWPGPPARCQSNTAIVAVGGDYKKPEQSAGTAAYMLDNSYNDSTTTTQSWTAAQTPPHGYRSSVAYDPIQKLWITVGPNGTDISRDDGKNWTPLKPSGYDPPDADKNWNALSLPFVVGPHGRIGRLRTIPNPQK